jgi:hypothetical protein
VCLVLLDDGGWCQPTTRSVDLSMKGCVIALVVVGTASEKRNQVNFIFGMP